MSKYLALVIVALATICVLLGAFGKQQYDLRAQAEYRAERLTAALVASQEARKRSDAAVVLLRRKNASLARERASAGASLEAAKAANPAWSAQEVPKEVQDALR